MKKQTRQIKEERKKEGAEDWKVRSISIRHFGIQSRREHKKKKKRKRNRFCCVICYTCVVSRWLSFFPQKTVESRMNDLQDLEAKEEEENLLSPNWHVWLALKTAEWRMWNGGGWQPVTNLPFLLLFVVVISSISYFFVVLFLFSYS